jgi:hypothetical protein
MPGLSFLSAERLDSKGHATHPPAGGMPAALEIVRAGQIGAFDPSRHLGVWYANVSDGYGALSNSAAGL